MNILSCVCGGVIESALLAIFAGSTAVMWLFRKLMPRSSHE